SSAGSGISSAVSVGYGMIQPDRGSTPSGLAIFGLRQNDVLVSEASVAASPLMRTGRTYVEMSTTVRTGLAIANPSSETAVISFFFTDSSGNFGGATTTIPPKAQIAKFLDEAPFKGRSPLNGTITFTATVPVAVVALRGLSNERGEFLITTLPVADLS